MAVDSAEIEYLSAAEVKQNFDGVAPAYREWLVAKCLPESAAQNPRLVKVVKGIPISDTSFTAAELKIIDDYFPCSFAIMKKETDRLWSRMAERRFNMRYERLHAPEKPAR